mgnify:CR=1 FL=1
MKIKKININNFGLISNKSISLENGINIIYTENKQVKTIIQNFIVCFLYGMDNDRKVLKSFFRRKYSPFSMERTKGELVIEKNNVEYSIERTFGSSKVQDSSSVTRVCDGEKIFNLNLDQPGKTFLDIGFEAFNRTMFVKNIDDFVSLNGDSKLMNDISKIKENFDNRFSFDRSVELINSAKDVIKNIKVSVNLNELYEKYSKLVDKLNQANEVVHLNSLDENRLNVLIKRREQLINNFTNVEVCRKYFKYINLKNLVSQLCCTEDEIDKLESDFKNIDDDIPKIDGEDLSKDFIDELKQRVSIYKERKREVLKVNKLDFNEECKVFERFEYLNRELDKYVVVKSNLLFYTDKVKKIENLNMEIDKIKGNSRFGNLFNKYKNSSRLKKNKQKKGYKKVCLSVLLLCLLITVFAPVLNINKMGIVLISLTSLVLVGIVYVSILYKEYKDLENVDSQASKFYDLKNQISKIENELYPYSYYKIKKDVDNIKKIEDELDELSFRFKDGDLSYTSVIKSFKKEEKILLDMLKRFGFEDLYIQDIENFIDNLEFKLNHRESVKNELALKKNELKNILNNRNKYDLINEMESLEEYENTRVSKTESQIESEYTFLKNELKEIDTEICLLKGELKNYDNNKYQVNLINDEINSLKGTISYLESKIINIDMYINKVTDIYYELKETFSSEISSRIDYVIKYLNKDSLSTRRISGGVGSDGSVLVKERLGIEFLNVGMWDLIYFALRITIADLIYEDKGEVPLILDDLFLSYDDSRMKKALMLLEKYSKDRQVILFVSTKREVEFLKGNAYIINL